MKIYSVSEILNEVKWFLEDTFGTITVSGEVSGVTHARSGHLYFTLKDAKGSLSSVMWASRADRLKFKVEEGLKILATGTLTIYPPSGRFQLIADRIVPEGIGALQLAFEQLKKKLAAEGLFDAGSKRPIPTLPLRIGLITSPEGAAIRDFLTMLKKSPLRTDVLLYPARVQGREAVGEIVQGLKALDNESMEVIVITRGGGSLEDLQPFNEEAVARAIHRTAIPVISAVGHEVDTTIADFVADLRLATPTAAGEFISACLGEASDLVVGLREDLVASARERVALAREEIGQIERLINPLRLVERVKAMRESHERLSRLLRQSLHTCMAFHSGRLVEVKERLRETIHTFVLRASRLLPTRRHLLHLLTGNVAGQRRRVKEVERSLTLLGPQQVLSRGYSITRKIGDGVVKESRQVAVGENLEIILSKGRLKCRVQKQN